MKKAVLAILLLVLVGAVLYFGYHYFQGKKGAEEANNRGEKVVFRVEEKSYTLADFENYVKILNPDRQELPGEALSQLFDQFIEDKLILYSAMKQGLELTAEEKEAFLRRMTRDYPAEEGLAEKLAADRGLEESLLVEKYKHEKIKEVVVTEDEIKKYYEENKKDFLAPERVRVSQILVGSSEQAIKLREKLQGASEEEFRQAAREFSKAPDAYKGGVMGVFRPGELPADMEKVIFSLEEGRLSTVFQSAYGYHIFRLDRRYSPSLLSLEEAYSRIRNLLLERKVKNIVSREVEELKATYHWEVYPANLPFKYEGN
ncbi:MAG: Peptidyl-prolyl cis-trans isomerase PpiD [Candidatus Saccharicenans subterraneus]|uniref:Peptidyl-prolyl cis-trans isomerase PpiD n=1 Tax=Candidatus Saccharicenans subterraneus TaxID=2508984 RepID=A0A3E2BN89_9BACT|nr:MAG: Peptidyl-prolyl cis-trans isomerase PpiD [Candidatus Saccharicenans subterraneum]